MLYGAGAESAVYADANGALVKCRQFVETHASELITRTGIKVSGTIWRA